VNEFHARLPLSQVPDVIENMVREFKVLQRKTEKRHTSLVAVWRNGNALAFIN